MPRLRKARQKHRVVNHVALVLVRVLRSNVLIFVAETQDALSLRSSISLDNLLVQASLEALLNRSANRNDTQARLERVKAAALIECAHTGLAGLTIVGIAKRAKVSSASIYTAYSDRDAVLVAAMEMLFAMLATDKIEVPQIADPRERVAQLLIAHGLVYEQPLTLWLFRLHMALVWSGNENLRKISLTVFEGIDGFWQQFLSGLIDEGYLLPLDLKQIVPLLLASVERGTIISRLACGDSGLERPEYTQIAYYAAKQLFDRWGSNLWHQHFNILSKSKVVAPDLDRATVLAASTGLKRVPFPDIANIHNGQDQQPAFPHRQRSVKERRARTIQAAIAVCREHGYDAASVQEVANRAHVSTATLYKDFIDKADLFACALEAELLEVWQLGSPPLGARDVLNNADPSGSTALAQAIFDIAQRATDPDWRWTHNIIMASEISGSPRIVAVARNIRAREESHLRQALSAPSAAVGQSSNDVSLEVNLLLGLIERRGTLSMLLFGQKTVDMSELARCAILAARAVVAT